ncbi:hypothetical protein H696_02275 [Fonticula alba]|uniref:Uncharacterized protein n=1 Tax=Fonticula alba TaxID=691883 RepID=A0A058ZAG6_FONAL|nr:hypothetical protein H696_02275 [Fonticula alba]KCV71330.1 hypothetical protein H696_02275 [Fonticula alba]|eukprot:XP_009494453.1 hypothetical protein H696_02275 [Fonticula alba]
MAPPRHKTGSPATALALVAAVLVAVSWLLAVVAGAPGPDFGAYADPLEKSLNGQVISTSASYALRVLTETRSRRAIGDSNWPVPGPAPALLETSLLQLSSASSALSASGSTDPNCPPSGEVVVTWTGVGISASVLIINILLSVAFGLKLHFGVIVSAIRCALQLTLMGFILTPVLEEDNIYMVFGLTSLLMLLASLETTFNKGPRRIKNMFWIVAGSIVLSNLSCSIFGTVLSLGASPFWEPALFVPTVGMMVGNSMAAVALGVHHVLDSAEKDRQRLEWHLALGASRWETAQPLVVAALRIAMLPTLNAMSVMGLISIPGTMTGQILAGADPMNAARYQQVIMFLMTASTMLSVTGAVTAVAMTLFDKSHRLRLDRITTRPLWPTRMARWIGQRVFNRRPAEQGPDSRSSYAPLTTERSHSSGSLVVDTGHPAHPVDPAVCANPHCPGRSETCRPDTGVACDAEPIPVPSRSRSSSRLSHGPTSPSSSVGSNEHTW